ncbi:MAG: hypothetical protein FD163_2245 [Hyphomonadaceae bacterium]|nr:MAG: hypothetical protein FD128_1491 [Hyphomonadaceae bacterium]KAF0183525.1 MAG: hypothetical protein FD163_2245 [Hyphomonadaceae bacterium]
MPPNANVKRKLASFESARTMIKPSMLLILKLVLVPFFIGLISAATRRFGALIGGIIAGLPAVAGPIVYVLALEHGADYVRTASISTLAGLMSFSAFGIAYSWMAKHTKWPIAIVIALICWFISTYFIHAFEPNLLAAFALAIIGLVVALLVLKVHEVAESGVSNKEIILRMVLGAALTLFVSFASGFASVSITGFLAGFPVFGTIFMVSTHTKFGAEHCANLFRGWTWGLFSYALFFASLVILLGKMGINSAFLLASLISLLPGPIIYLAQKKR